MRGPHASLPADLRARLAAALEAAPPVVAARAAPGRRHEVGGLWASSAALTVAALARGRGRCVAVAPDPEAADALLLDIAALAPDLPAAVLPVEETDLPDGPEARANRSERLVALASLGEPGDGLLVTPGAVLLEALPEPAGEALVLARGERCERDRLVGRLVEAGFDRVSLVAAPGEVSVRGDIVDVYPWAAEHPLRIELLDDEVEDLRRFEVDAQTSVEVLDTVRLVVGEARPAARDLDGLLPSDASVFLIDPPSLKDRLAEAAFLRDVPPRRIDRALAAVRARPGADLFALDLGRQAADLSIGAASGGGRAIETVVGEWRAAGRDVTILCETAAEADRLAESLAHHGLRRDVDASADATAGTSRKARPHARAADSDKARAPSTHAAEHAAALWIVPGRLTRGFAFPGGGPVVVHHHELIGRRAVRRSRPRRVVVSRAIDSLAELHPGDYVVHLTHGVAHYRGMQRLAREQGEEDFLVLEFADETTLYVPASRVDLVERYVGGGEGARPSLDKIGGKSWRRKKEKVARAVQDLASDLLALQTARRAGRGFAFPPDDALQGRFEAAFPHDDTPDQGTSWHEIRGDMEAERPMDRLLVGDVGFGKTEVAVRAAYKAVLAGKQVALLVPTTILAEQHFDTFSARMADEPVRVEVLSRLRAGVASGEVLADLAAGKVDVIIGTHRLLVKDVRFADLGLVVVDEEQRFGVAHKEALKRLKATVDVVTLSATPIPRTLHMAMSGLRDISTIRTPPPGRKPVVTRVAYEDDEVLRKAIRHEVGRGGQVFVLHNRVQTIERMVGRVREMVPTARTAFAHGQMGAHALRDVIEAFAGGEIDVLVCTTIIESGIDIPRANTIVVTDAHRFGLADMHQLRGRVGRENVQAYAFFLTPRDEPIPDGAARRLKAIEEYSSLGSGLPIALRDLELRGAGNLLGAEQSGHILAVGYDMYCRLLKAAVARAKGKRVEEEPGEVEVELGITAYLPSSYVTDEVLRMSLLRRMSGAGRRRLEHLARELEDRFGRLPEPAVALLDLLRLRRRVAEAGITSLLADGLGGAVLTIGDAATFERRSPFAGRELIPVTPGRFRVEWPAAVQTAAHRLRYLLERFDAAPRPAAVPAR